MSEADEEDDDEEEEAEEEGFRRRSSLAFIVLSRSVCVFFMSKTWGREGAEGKGGRERMEREGICKKAERRGGKRGRGEEEDQHRGQQGAEGRASRDSGSRVRCWRS